MITTRQQFVRSRLGDEKGERVRGRRREEATPANALGSSYHITGSAYAFLARTWEVESATARQPLQNFVNVPSDEVGPGGVYENAL